MPDEQIKRDNALNRACAVLDLSIRNFKASVHQAVVCAQGPELHEKFKQSGHA